MTEIQKSGLKTHFLFNKLLSDRVISLVVFLFVFICYELQAPTRLSSANYGSDGGDYLTSVLTGGVPHPTGYPLYLLLSSAFHILPISTPVWQQVQVSVFASSACVACLCYLLLRLAGPSTNRFRVWFAVLCSLLLAFSQLFWSQSVIIEVYTLHSLLIILALIWIARYFKQTDTNNYVEICIFSWVCGLGLANHTTFVLIYPVIFYAHFWWLARCKVKRWIFLSATGWISGAIIYILLPLRAAQNPPIAWGDPTNLQGYLWLVTGGDYGQILFAITPMEFINRLFASLALITQQFGYLGVILGLIGLFQHNQDNHLRWSTLYISLVYLTFAIGYKTNDSLVYLLPCFICIVIWIYWGLIYFQQFTWKSVNVSHILSILLALTLVVSIPQTSRAIDPRSGDLADYAESTMALAKRGELIKPHTDGETFALWYYQYGLQYRPDLVIISEGLLKYDWYQDEIKELYPRFFGDH